MEETVKVDKEWKDEAKKTKEDMASKERPYVSCVEVKQYLSELRMVMMQIADGIGSSIEEMEKRTEAGEPKDVK